MAWFELHLNVAEPLREATINRLFELGAQGVNESDVALLAYFDTSERDAVLADIRRYLGELAELHPELPVASVSAKDIKDENWADRYKEFYKAQKLTDTIFLKPAWDKETQVPQGMIPIVMDPGQAFGTGLHPSTVLTLRLLESILDDLDKLDTIRLIDVGTGSGILAIAAWKLGVHRVDAIDIDPLAVQTAMENSVQNGCPNIVFSDEQLERVSSGYDIVLSNILLETHRELAPHYHRVLATGGRLVLSGLLGGQKDDLSELITRHGFVLEETLMMQEWIAFTFRKA